MPSSPASRAAGIAAIILRHNVSAVASFRCAATRESMTFASAQFAPSFFVSLLRATAYRVLT